MPLRTAHGGTLHDDGSDAAVSEDPSGFAHDLYAFQWDRCSRRSAGEMSFHLAASWPKPVARHDEVGRSEGDVEDAGVTCR